MRLTILALTLALTACGDSADRTYAGVASAIHDCGKEKKVAIDGSGGSFTFNGTCDSVTINGSDNKLTAEATKAVTVNGARNVIAIAAVDRISVRGSANTVTWRKGLPGDAPYSATASGNDNTIEQAK